MPHEFGSFTFGTTPKNVIVKAAKGEDFTMVIRPRSEREAVDKAFRRAKLRLSDWDGENARIVASELYRFLQALMRTGEEGESLRSGMLEVLGIEEI
jgi:hypothetical protein